VVIAAARGLALSHPGVPGAMLAAGFLLSVWAMVSLALGAIIRHKAGALSATVGVIYVLAVLCLFLPSPWNDRIGRFTLAIVAYQVVSLHPPDGSVLPGPVHAGPHRLASRSPPNRRHPDHPPGRVPPARSTCAGPSDARQRAPACCTPGSPPAILIRE
jgi:hypothetical protein